MDDTNLAYLCDDKMREAASARGDDPDELPHRYATFINRVVAKKPAGMTLAVHLCRGNFQSTWAAQGGYEPVAEALLSEMDVDAYFLEYDDARWGDFKPLRFLPKGKIVVLGLVTTKLGALEKKDDLKRRIDEAAKYAPLDQLALSPQCGFPAPCTATTSPSKRSAPSCAWWSTSPRSLGLTAEWACWCELRLDPGGAAITRCTLPLLPCRSGRSGSSTRCSPCRWSRSTSPPVPCCSAPARERRLLCTRRHAGRACARRAEAAGSHRRRLRLPARSTAPTAAR